MASQIHSSRHNAPLPSKISITKYALLLMLLLNNSTGCQDNKNDLKTDKHPQRNTTQITLKAISKPAPRPNNYIGSKACIECHAEIWADFQVHPMAQSAAIVHGASPDQTFDQHFFPAAQGFFYRVEQTDAGLIHHEQKRDSSGTVLASFSQTMSFSIGSGKRGKSYLWSSGGFLFQSPVTWYTASQRWDLAPGYANQNRHFERRVTAECVQCHVGRMNIINKDESRFGSPPFLELGIGCESCHGPGESHISVRRTQFANQTEATFTDPIVNPSKLPAQNREAVCNQCHLPTSHRVLRYGRNSNDFRPGDSLDDIWVIMTSETSADDSGTTEAVSHVPQMHASRCYQASGGQLGCNSCHSPHRVPLSSERVSYYRQRCLKCHEENNKRCSESVDARRNSGDSCYECHMPQLSASNVPHTSQTDHRIIRKRLSNASPFKDASELKVFDGGAERLPTAEVIRARGILMSQFAQRDQDRLLAAAAVQTLESVASDFPNDEPHQVALGFAHTVENRPQRAREIWEQVVRINPRSEDGWRGIGMQAHDAGDLNIALDAFRRVLALNPHDRIAIGRSIHVLGMLRRFDEGIALAKTAIEMFPADPQLHQWLAEAYRSVGQNSNAEHHFRLSQALDPKTRDKIIPNPKEINTKTSAPSTTSRK